MQEYNETSQVTYTIDEYLEYCKENKLAYASAAERLVHAIGEPQFVDTSTDPVLGRIFMNKTIRVYPAFKDFFGMEEVVEKIVGYFRHSAQGLEEKKQILYLLGPVGGGKSSLAEKIKELMENNYLANSFVNPYDSNDIYTCDNNKITDDFVIIINKNKYIVKLPGIGECE